MQGLRTDAGCFTPDVKEQADNYRNALTTSSGYRVVDGRLEVLDREGQTLLVLVRESTLR